MEWKVYPIVDQIQITKLYTFFKLYFEKSYEFKGETHDFWECMYVVKGSLCVSADERVYNIMEGDMIFHKPLELHKFYVTSETGAEILVFSFSADGPLLSFFENKVFRLSKIQKNIISALLDYVEEKQNHLGDNSCDEKYGRTLKTLGNLPICLHNIVLYICQLMLSLVQEGSVGKSYNTPDTEVFSKAIGYMNDHFNENPSVLAIASYCNVSVSGLKRIFDRFAGMGVHKYFLLLKLKEAKKMLCNGNSVNDTSEILGFSSQAYFSKTFKREVGISPSKFNKDTVEV